MLPFDKISIEQISRRDVLLILEALDFSYQQTQIEDFQNLRSFIVRELCSLTETKDETDLIRIFTQESPS